uniref:Uncharacterized protein n=1 Tax=Salix viminalis TaxID=40686 RepID=A0A6N2L8X4_SALVM
MATKITATISTRHIMKSHLPPGSNLPWALSLSQPSCLSALDMDSDLWTTGRCSATAGGARRNGTQQWRTGLTGGLLVDALSHRGHECRALPLRNQTNLLLLIVVVDDFEIAKRATLLFSRENDFFEIDDRNNL